MAFATHSVDPKLPASKHDCDLEFWAIMNEGLQEHAQQQGQQQQNGGRHVPTAQHSTEVMDLLTSSPVTVPSLAKAHLPTTIVEVNHVSNTQPVAIKADQPGDIKITPVKASDVLASNTPIPNTTKTAPESNADPTVKQVTHPTTSPTVSSNTKRSLLDGATRRQVRFGASDIRLEPGYQPKTQMPVRQPTRQQPTCQILAKKSVPFANQRQREQPQKRQQSRPHAYTLAGETCSSCCELGGTLILCPGPCGQSYCNTCYGNRPVGDAAKLAHLCIICRVNATRLASQPLTMPAPNVSVAKSGSHTADESQLIVGTRWRPPKKAILQAITETAMQQDVETQTAASPVTAPLPTTPSTSTTVLGPSLKTEMGTQTMLTAIHFGGWGSNPNNSAKRRLSRPLTQHSTA